PSSTGAMGPVPRPGLRPAVRRTGRSDSGFLMASEEKPFWRMKTLAEMTDGEWESLCDGCGRCCLVKLEEHLDGAPPPAGGGEAYPNMYFTDGGCRLLDADGCRCRDYPNRTAHVPYCVRLTPEVVAEIGWLPPTCGYRMVHE